MLVGRAGGLLKEAPPTALETEDVVVGRVLVESLGAVGLVNGLVDACVVGLLLVSSATPVRDTGRLSIWAVRVASAPSIAYEGGVQAADKKKNRK